MKQGSDNIVLILFPNLRMQVTGIGSSGGNDIAEAQNFVNIPPMVSSSPSEEESTEDPSDFTQRAERVPGFRNGSTH